MTTAIYTFLAFTAGGFVGMVTMAILAVSSQADDYAIRQMSDTEYEDQFEQVLGELLVGKESGGVSLVALSALLGRTEKYVADVIEEVSTWEDCDEADVASALMSAGDIWDEANGVTAAKCSCGCGAEIATPGRCECGSVHV